MQDTLPIGRLVVPETLRRDVLWTFHGIPLTGHNGRTKTTEMIQRYFWWPGMSVDIRRRVQGCRECQMRKHPRPTRHIAPGEFRATSPFSMVVIDTVGPMPPTKDGCKKLLTIVDVFSRYPIAIPIPNERAETVARALQKHLFSIHGYPKITLSDRAQGFVSKGLKWLCAHLGIAKHNGVVAYGCITGRKVSQKPQRSVDNGV